MIYHKQFKKGDRVRFKTDKEMTEDFARHRLDTYSNVHHGFNEEMLIFQGVPCVIKQADYQREELGNGYISLDFDDDHLNSQINRWSISPDLLLMASVGSDKLPVFSHGHFEATIQNDLKDIL